MAGLKQLLDLKRSSTPSDEVRARNDLLAAALLRLSGNPAVAAHRLRAAWAGLAGDDAQHLDTVLDRQVADGLQARLAQQIGAAL